MAYFDLLLNVISFLVNFRVLNLLVRICFRRIKLNSFELKNGDNFDIVGERIIFYLGHSGSCFDQDFHLRSVYAYLDSWRGFLCFGVYELQFSKEILFTG
jgi:hypothetical protein